MHETQHRGLRELYAFARQAATHFSRLAPRVAGTAAARELAAAEQAAAELLTELGSLTPDYGLFGQPAAQGVGASLADLRNGLGDRFLERNQAVRMAVLDLQHITTLLAYLRAVSVGRGDARLEEFSDRWEKRLVGHERALRSAAIAMGEDPDLAVAPLDSSPLGRAAHRVALGMGTAGEWFDARLGAGRGR